MLTGMTPMSKFSPRISC
uniref:Uncharacterized protein n=1 Tax=Arundo donax TaxID=35708 RepID=A0A0A9B3G2_ARUDO